MFQRMYDPNYVQLPPVTVEAAHREDFPARLSRLGKGKTEFVVRGLASALRSGDRVLDMFAGSGLGSVLIAQRIENPHNLICTDIHYAFIHPTSVDWKYASRENYLALSNYYSMTGRRIPVWMPQPTNMRLPLPDANFHAVFIISPPRTTCDRHDDMRYLTGTEHKLTSDGQKHLFEDAVYEAHRLLLPKHHLYATARTSWLSSFCFFKGVRISHGPSQELQFAQCKDPLVYVVAEK